MVVVIKDVTVLELWEEQRPMPWSFSFPSVARLNSYRNCDETSRLPISFLVIKVKQL